jgi:hypothetical protein
MRAHLLGVYPVVGSPEPCHLLELEVDAEAPFDVGRITQADAAAPPNRWQVPYDEHLVNDDGTLGKRPENPEAMLGRFRLAFFFHYLRVRDPLLTPAGLLQVPEPSQRPTRLASLEYEQP